MPLLAGSTHVWHHVLCLLFSLPLSLSPISRSFATPPKQVQVVLDCILIMRGYKEQNWKNAKAMMADTNFLRLLLTTDFREIPWSNVKAMRGEFLFWVLAMNTGSAMSGTCIPVQFGRVGFTFCQDTNLSAMLQMLHCWADWNNP